MFFVLPLQLFKMLRINIIYGIVFFIFVLNVHSKVRILASQSRKAFTASANCMGRTAKPVCSPSL